MDKDYEIQITSLNPEEIELLKDYWERENDEFKYTLRQLEEKYSLRTQDITKIVKNESKVEKRLACLQCNEEFYVRIETKGKWNTNHFFCTPCKDDIDSAHRESERKKKQERIYRVSQKLEDAVDKKLWELLSSLELNTLKEIVRLDNLNLIKKHVFHGDFFDQEVWGVVNKLEKVGLIHIQRKDGVRTVKDFLFDPRLKHILFDPHQDISNTENLTAEVDDYLSFSLVKKLVRTSVRQPHFSGTFILENDIILKKGETYSYGGWEQTDGSINLKFSQLKNYKPQVRQSVIEKEPKHVSDAIKDWFTELE